MKIYIAGKITGDKRYKAKFREAANALGAQGNIVLNPAILPAGLTDGDYMRITLAMYDGMSCGHIALDKLGANVERYYSTEIDKYAIQTTQRNYPDTMQLGDAFQVRKDDWDGGGIISAEREEKTVAV